MHRLNISPCGKYRNAGQVTSRRNVDHLLTDGRQGIYVDR
jgi:hypothetical protein